MPRRRSWTLAMQVREVGSGTVERKAREQLMEAARRREIDASRRRLRLALGGTRSQRSRRSREILRERTGAGLFQARLNGKRLGRPLTAGLHAAEIRKLHRAGIAKAEIARRLEIGRTSARRILG
jgi:DNA invertase Pin-like site-specific DNA recombinase